jgi:TonB family protein
MGLFIASSPAIAQEPPKPPSGIEPPIVLTHVDAVYPPSALTEQKHADVVLAVTVDADGHVSKVDVLTSGGDDLDQAAIVATRQWTFVPAKRNGKPVASRIRVPFHFAPPAPAPEIVEPPAPPEPELPSQQATLPAAPPKAAPPAPSNQSPSPGPAEKPNEASPTAAPSAEPSPAPPAEPAEVTIQGRRASPSRGASDFNVRVGELRNVPRQNASEMLKLAPGILLTNEGGEGHAEQVFLRGFDAREGQDIEFSVGGVPINESGNLHGNGYADTHFIIPELIQSLRVIEGPFDPRQGNYAVAGSANYDLGLDQRGLTARYTRGSFGTERLLLLYGPGQNAHTFGGAEIYKTDGFGQNRDAQRATAMGQYEGRVGDSSSFRITGTAYATTYHSAGVIRDDDFRAGRIGFYDSYDLTLYANEKVPQGGDASRYSLSADVYSSVGDTDYSQQVFLIARDMRLRENFTGFLLDVQNPVQQPHDQRGDMLDLDMSETTFGARGYARLHGSALGEKQQLEFGYFARGDRVDASQQRIGAATGVPYKTETNLQSELGDLGLYADADLHATPWLALRGGFRADLLAYDVNDLCAVQQVAHPSQTNPPDDQSCLDQQDRGVPREPNQRSSTASTAVLPRASIIFGPFQNFSVSMSYGQGVRSIDPSYITQDVKTPFASIVGYEGGVTYAGGVGDWTLVARSIFFQTHVDRDLIFSETEGRNVLGVGTTRTGWVGAGRLTGRFLDETANLTLVKSTYDDTHLLVAYVPGVVLRSDTALFSDLPWELMGQKVRGTLAAGVTYVGPRALPFGEESESIFTIDTSATLHFRNFEFGLSVTNLLNRQYRLGEYNFASDFRAQRAQFGDAQPTLVPMRHFTAGAPRGIFATFSVNFGGAG